MSADLLDAPVPGFSAQGLPQRLGELLVGRGLVASADLQRALAVQVQVGGRIGQVLVRLGALSEETLLPVLVEQLGIPALQASEWPEDAAALKVDPALGIAADWFVDQGVVAWTHSVGGTLVVARDPLDPALAEILESRLPAGWRWRLARSQEVERLVDALQRANRSVEDDADDAGHLRELAEEAPVIELVNNLLAQAMDRGASDIHVEPAETTFSVRFRVDGVLHEVLSLPFSRFAAVA
ncbi:MAG: ATPase, T2SS/T4P/T4SS family, partial [Silanimonas sp.]